MLACPNPEHIWGKYVSKGDSGLLEHKGSFELDETGSLTLKKTKQNKE